MGKWRYALELENGATIMMDACGVELGSSWIEFWDEDMRTAAYPIDRVLGYRVVCATADLPPEDDSPDA